MTKLTRKIFAPSAVVLLVTSFVCFYAFHSLRTTAQAPFANEGEITGHVLDENQRRSNTSRALKARASGMKGF